MIKIICVGKLKEDYWKDAIKEYSKRMSKYTKLEIIEVTDAATDQPELTQKKEKVEIERYIQEKDYVMILDILGKSYTSIEFSDLLEKSMMYHSNITMIIGGSCGLDPEIKKRADLSISFSELTFPHQMFRVMLLEQIYRAFKIMNHESYHK